jgi:tetratricopeptide (TPR) repeat protein
MSFLRWPQLVRPTAICFLSKAGLSGVRVVSGLASVFFLALSLWRERSALAATENGEVLILPAVMIPATIVNVIWSLSFLFFYLYLGRRAWRIDQELRGLTAGSIHASDIPWPRRSIGGLAWVLAIGFAMSLIVWEGGVAMLAIVGKSLESGTASGATLENIKGAVDSQLNKVAWQQATNPDPAARAPNPTLFTALEAVKLDPGNARSIAILGVARYRTKEYSGAITDLERSIKLSGWSASSIFFLAMARAQNGELDQAKKLYDQADRWMIDHQSEDGELSRFREEAAAVIYMRSLDAARTPPKKQQAASGSNSGARSKEK